MPILDENMQPLKPGTLFEGLAIDPTAIERAKPKPISFVEKLNIACDAYSDLCDDTKNNPSYTPHQRDEAFDIVALTIGTKYEPHFDEALEISNNAAFQIWKQQKDKELQSVKVLSQHSDVSTYTAIGVAQILNPIPGLAIAIILASIVLYTFSRHRK